MMPSAMGTVGQPVSHQVLGIYAGSVHDNNDPLSQGRCRLLIPQVMGPAITRWAIQAGGSGVTPVGTVVMCAFIGGDINNPVYFASSPSSTNNNFYVDATGKLHWGPGALGAFDTNLYRQSANVLATDSAFNVGAAMGVLGVLSAFGGIGVRLLFDPNNRFQIDSATGKVSWGTGSSSVDTVLYRAGAAQLASDNIAKNISGSAETWHSMTLLASWANTGAPSPLAQYRLEPDNTVWLSGDISGGTITSPTTIATLPAGYRPASTNLLPLFINTGASVAQTLSPSLSLDSSGNVIIHNVPTSTTRIAFNGKVKLDA